jgi:ketosteroid isomerase-like protein
MGTRLRWLVLVAAAAAACSSSSATTGAAAGSSNADSAQVKAAIEAANARFLDAFKRGDKAGLMANYTADAILMMPNEPAWRGRDGIDKGFSAFLDQVSFEEGAATTSDVMVAGDLAVETGTFQWTLKRKQALRSKTKASI